jgi:hypothetical protein
VTGTAPGPGHGACDEGGEAPCYAHLLDDAVPDPRADPPTSRSTTLSPRERPDVDDHAGAGTPV